MSQMTEEQVKALRGKYLSTIKFLKKKLPLKYARVGDQRVEYFRLQDLETVISNYKPNIQALLNTTQDPLDLMKTEALFYLARPLNAKALKYPQVLDPSYTPTQFGSFRFVVEESKRWLMIGTVLAILFLVLFPIWPYWMKYYVWLTSLVLLVISVGLLALRLVLYSVLSLFGYSFWLFPQLLASASFLDSFKPVVSAQRWEKSTFSLVLRAVIFSVFIYYGYEIYSDPTFVFENFQQTKEAVRDLHDWGVSKIKNQKNFTQRALTGSLEKILNETQDINDTEKEQATATNTSAGEGDRQL